MYRRSACPNDASLELQAQQVREYAAERGYQLVAEFTDIGAATQAQAQGFTSLLRYVRTQDVQLCLIYQFDRLARSYPIHASRTAQLRESGVDVTFVHGPHRSVQLLFDTIAEVGRRHG